MTVSRFHSIPVPLPGLGLPLMREFADDTLGCWARLAKAGDAVTVRMLGQRVHFLFHPELVRAALLEDEQSLVKENRQLRVFAFAQGDNVLTTTGPDWKRQRRLLGPVFAPRRMAQYASHMDAAAREAHARLLPDSPGARATVDAAALASEVTMDAMLRVLFRQTLPPARTVDIRTAVRRVLEQGQRMIMWPVIPPDWLPFPGRTELLEHRELLRSTVRAQIEARRDRLQSEGTSPRDTAQPAGDPSDDLLETMLRAEDDSNAPGATPGDRRLSASEVEDNALALFLAGHETSATGLTWWMGLMAAHPEHAQRAREEVANVLGPNWHSDELSPEALLALERLDFLEASIRETLRLRPPVAGAFNRRAVRALSLNGVDIARGDLVSASIWQLHHDPRWHPEPERFRPERFLAGAPEIPRGAWMPFGAGQHVCLGQHFAMLEMKLVAARLLSQTQWRFAPGEDLPDPRLDIALKPMRAIRLEFTGP